MVKAPPADEARGVRTHGRDNAGHAEVHARTKVGMNGTSTMLYAEVGTG